MYFNIVADEVFTRYSRIWKAKTLQVNKSYLQNCIKPWFAHMRIEEIKRSDVHLWFASLAEKPASANRSLPILSVIMRQSELYGYRLDDSNPCKGIKRYSLKHRDRFLSDQEYINLGAALNNCKQQDIADLIRLLLLTGCRQSEIRTLSWDDYRHDALYLRDSKTGPRTIFLAEAAQRILNRQPCISEFVFPSPPMNLNRLYRGWAKISIDANITGVRLHDLRHSYASFASRSGESVVTISKLLGHGDPRTTFQYTHTDDPSIRRAAEQVTFMLKSA